MIRGETIRRLRENRGLSQLELARKVGIAQNTAYRWESGDRSPSKRKIEALAEALGVSVAELVDADGEARKSEEVVYLPILTLGSPVKGVGGIAEALLESSRTFPFPKAHLGRVDGVYPCFSVLVRGGSMAGFGIPNGAHVAVNPNEKVRSGFLALVCMGGSLAFKKVYERGEAYELVTSDGRPSRLVTEAECASGWFYIAGKAMGVYAELDHTP